MEGHSEEWSGGGRVASRLGRDEGGPSWDAEGGEIGEIGELWCAGGAERGGDGEGREW